MLALDPREKNALILAFKSRSEQCEREDKEGGEATAAPVLKPTLERLLLSVRLHIIDNARIKNVGKYQSCMVSKLPIICKQTDAFGEAKIFTQKLVQLLIAQLGKAQEDARAATGAFPYNP